VRIKVSYYLPKIVKIFSETWFTSQPLCYINLCYLINQIIYAPWGVMETYFLGVNVFKNLYAAIWYFEFCLKCCHHLPEITSLCQRVSCFLGLWF
jgi:hypothetical protein